MRNAVRDYLSKKKSRESLKRQKEAEVWIFNTENDPDSPFNLENICLHINQNPDILRLNIKLAREAGMSLSQYMVAWETGKLKAILEHQLALGQPVETQKKKPKRKAM